jgi:hypothetical protein
MEITLTRNTTRKSDRPVYNIAGRKGSVQISSKALFDKVPDTLTLVGTFAAPKAKETPAERKARLAAITPAERLAKMEERLTKMRAKLAAAPAAEKAVPTKAAPAVAKGGKK